MLKPDTPIGQVLTWACNLLLLSLLYLVFSLPVFTAGAAAIALYEMVYAVREGRDGILFKDYFLAFCRNFKKGLGMLVVYAAAALLIGSITGTLGLLGAPVKPVLAILIAVVGGIVCWALALTGRYEQKLGTTVYNAYVIAIHNLPVTLLLSILNFGPIALLFLLLPTDILRWYIFALMFFIPAGCAFLTAEIVLRVLKKQYPDQV